MNIYAFFTLCVILIFAAVGTLSVLVVFLLKRIDKKMLEKRRKMRRADKKKVKQCQK